MARVSAIVIVKNEEASLPRCLKSLHWADQIIVLDSGSTDRTVEIAREMGAEVFVEEWKGYTAQKNSALEKATGDWVVSLDADEEFTAEAQDDVRKFVNGNSEEIQAYAFRRKVLYLGKWITHGDWYPDYVVRLWRRGSGRFEGMQVHESLKVNGAVQQVSSEILHYTYKDLEDQKARMQKYARLWAEDQFSKKRPYRMIDQWARPPLRFARAILLKAGWLDGWRGWLIAWMCAREVALKYQHLRSLWNSELRIQNSERKT
jgi:hypothetical protein